MATQSQIDANRKNATRSTGPRTEAGKNTSSQNHLTLGLYTRTDYVKPEERDFYKEFSETMYSELSPIGMLEDTLASEIIGASWRLRRCSSAEADLADFDDKTEKTRRSIDRARASSHSHFHRSINQLRKMQTERAIRIELYGEDMPGLADCNKIEAARKKNHRDQKSAAAKAEDAFMKQVMAFCEPDPTVMKRMDAELMAKYCPRPTEGHAATAALALNCNSGQDLSPQVLNQDETPSSLALNCNSGQDLSPQVPNEDETSSSLALNCNTEEETATSELSDDEFLALDEESQLKKLIEQEEIDEQILEHILKAA